MYIYVHTQMTDKEILAQAEPHIARLRGATVVVKYGGHAMENDDLKAKFASDIALLKQVCVYMYVCMCVCVYVCMCVIISW